MKWWSISVACMLCCMPMHAAHVADSVCAETGVDTIVSPATTYDTNTQRYKNFFHALIPNQTTVQFAGSIGVISYGIGWHYGRHNNWETELLLGHVPKYHSHESKMTFTAKQRYIPWHLELGSRWHVHPLTAGIYFNSIFGEDFWVEEPMRYPKKYYGFSSKVRIGAYIGSRLYYKIARSDRRFLQGVALYYELGTNELYLISALPNKNVRASDILSLAFGVTFDIF